MTTKNYKWTRETLNQAVKNIPNVWMKEVGDQVVLCIAWDNDNFLEIPVDNMTMNQLED